MITLKEFLDKRPIDLKEVHTIIGDFKVNKCEDKQPENYPLELILAIALYKLIPELIKSEEEK